MKELIVISGKGGTGKTSIVASLAALSERIVLADCDVDAADLHLVLEPKILRRADFSGGSRAAVVDSLCTGCGECERLCRFGAVSRTERPDRPDRFEIDPIACEGCGVCAWFCPAGAILFEPVVNGQWYVSETRCGPMVHARLGIAEENSGKLVSMVRAEARAIAEREGVPAVLVDGSPGIGCAVIASITGADLVLIVTEPTRSALHDLGRVADLTKHFGIETRVCVNKWDLNQDMLSEIEACARERGLRLAGRVRYDRAVTEAQMNGVSLVEYTDRGAADDVQDLYGNLMETLT